MKHALLGKIAIAATIVFLIGVCGTIAFGFQKSIFQWDFTTPKTKVVSLDEANTKKETVGLEGAKSADVDIYLGAGTLDLSGDSEPLMTGTFTYNKALKPLVKYDVKGHQGHLKIHQTDPPFKVRLGDNKFNRWKIQLNKDVPLNLSVRSGAAKSTLNLAGLRLRHFRANLDVGESTIDLRGNWKNSFDVDISAGVGKTTILLPRNTGVEVKVEQSLSKVTTSGLKKLGDRYYNQAYDTSKIQIKIDMAMDVGKALLKVGD
ncbi:toast rack family protein [Camelliibacillus cellulosilyticus]|uniref:Toast rack family protein n=1 Tax=Camelliibacillus cellulosilyticus TaxID=2174486 RepID=A0ABV9GKH6_9BACL